jgi:hypothetical protein
VGNEPAEIIVALQGICAFRARPRRSLSGEPKVGLRTARSAGASRVESAVRPSANETIREPLPALAIRATHMSPTASGTIGACALVARCLGCARCRSADNPEDGWLAVWLWRLGSVGLMIRAG